MQQRWLMRAAPVLLLGSKSRPRLWLPRPYCSSLCQHRRPPPARHRRPPRCHRPSRRHCRNRLTTHHLRRHPCRSFLRACWRPRSRRWSFQLPRRRRQLSSPVAMAVVPYGRYGSSWRFFWPWAYPMAWIEGAPGVARSALLPLSSGRRRGASDTASRLGPPSQSRRHLVGLIARLIARSPPGLL